MKTEFTEFAQFIIGFIFVVAVVAAFSFAAYRLTREAQKTNNYENLILFLILGACLLASLLIIRYVL